MVTSNPGVCGISLAQASGVHSIDNCVNGKQYKRSTVAARAVRFLNGTSSSSIYRSGRALAVTENNVVYTLGCGGQLHVCV